MKKQYFGTSHHQERPLRIPKNILEGRCYGMQQELNGKVIFDCTYKYHPDCPATCKQYPFQVTQTTKFFRKYPTYANGRV